MKSKWFELKPLANKLREEGNSIRDIEKSLNIPRSTLSGWFKNIKLTPNQKAKLRENLSRGLQKARAQAVLWHNKQKEIRLREAEEYALQILSKLDVTNKFILELALAMLYLGEGAKTKNGTCMGSSNPLILKFFITSLLKIYDLNIATIKCALHLRVDQDPTKLARYWSEELKIPLQNFTSPSIDLRSLGKPTYSNYNGVCVVSCGNIALQRRLVYLSRKFCEKVYNP